MLCRLTRRPQTSMAIADAPKGMAVISPICTIVYLTSNATWKDFTTCGRKYSRLITPALVPK